MNKIKILNSREVALSSKIKDLCSSLLVTMLDLITLTPKIFGQ